MKKIHFFLLFAFMVSQFSAFSQIGKINVPGLDVPPLIFTEIRMNTASQSYVELTNVGDKPIDLHNFTLSTIDKYSRMIEFTESLLRVAETFEYRFPLATTMAVGSVSILPPGKSLVIMPVYDKLVEDGLPIHNIAMLDKADFHFHCKEIFIYDFLNKPELQAFDKDSVEAGFEFTHKSPTGIDITTGYLLKYRYTDNEGNEDFAYVDQFNCSWDPNFGNEPHTQQGEYQTPIAGNPNALRTCVMVRKANITQGNMDWHNARGVNLELTEWMPVPLSDSKYDVFTTVGTHGNFDLVIKAKDGADIVIDEANSTITLPWNVQRGDSVSHLFDLGPGMSWSYALNGTAGDSAYANVQTGDKFTLYALGNSLKTKEFQIIVKQPTNDLAVIYQSFVQSGPNWRERYRVSNGRILNGVEVDSITRVPFATRTDTLLKYLYAPEGATMSFVFSDGKNRVDLMHEDILRVTSADGNKTKDYIISVDEYDPNNNADLSSMTWPDVNTAVYWEFLDRGDTIPDFSPSKVNYALVLKKGTKNIPAIQFKAAHTNATFTVKRATNLYGSIEERTTRVTVTAPDGETVKEYYIRFTIEGDPVQPNRAEPFFSELWFEWGSSGRALEIYNPGTEDLDLGKYMIVKGEQTSTPKSAVEYLRISPVKHSDPKGECYIYANHYVPGYKWRGITQQSTSWPVEDQGFLEADGVINSIVKPNDVFLFGNPTFSNGHKHKNAILTEFDMLYAGFDDQGKPYNPWGMEQIRLWETVTYVEQERALKDRECLYLFKILNDSILNGTKKVTDVTAYKLIDRIQPSPNVEYMWIGGRGIGVGGDSGFKISRKPHIYKGVTGRAEGFGDNDGMSAENCDWIVMGARDEDATNFESDCMGFHVMHPNAKHYSTITSNNYKVTKGYEGELTIMGSVNGVSLSNMTDMLTKADEEQIFEFMDITNAVVTDGTIAENMTLKVTSPNLVNTSIYTFVQADLDGDNELKSNDGSTLAVTLNGSVGVVSGIEIGASLRSVLDQLTVPDKAVLNVIDEKGNIASIKVMSLDSVVIDRIAGPNLTLEVIAENYDKALYSLDFGQSESDAVLFSNILYIDQQTKKIVNAPEAVDAKSIFQYIYANKGATVKVVDKAGFERNTGFLQIDDQILVVSKDQQKSELYDIEFITRRNYFGLHNAIRIAQENYNEHKENGNYSTVVKEMAYNAIEAAKLAITKAETQDDITEAIIALQTAMVGFVPGDVSINEYNNAEHINIFPNPASDMIFIDNIEGEATVIISNVVGQQLRVTNTNNTKVAIPLGNLSNGIYMITLVKNGIAIKTEMIVKQ